MATSAPPSNSAEISISCGTPIRSTSRAVSAGPASAPHVPPAAMMPYSRVAWSVVKMSDMKLQNTDTTNRLNTLTQMKNAGTATAIPTSARNTT